MSTRDSQVRQAAAAFVVAEYADTFDDSEAAETVRAALRGLASWSVPFEGGEVVSRSGAVEAGQAGAAAFALLTELMFFSATGDSTFEKNRQAWLQALLQLQRPGGGFWRSPYAEVESDYYNGETWLALAHYRRIFPDNAAVNEALAKADAYMIARYSDDPGSQFVHWGLMTASVRYLTDPGEEFAAFLDKLGEAYRTDVHPKLDPSRNGCSGVEGLAAAALALKQAGAEETTIGRITERMERELANSFEMQLLPRQTRIELGPDRYLAAPDLDAFTGAFLNGRHRPQIRVDSTQHCLSATMKLMAFKQSQSE